MEEFSVGGYWTVVSLKLVMINNVLLHNKSILVYPFHVANEPLSLFLRFATCSRFVYNRGWVKCHSAETTTGGLGGASTWCNAWLWGDRGSSRGSRLWCGRRWRYNLWHLWRHCWSCNTTSPSNSSKIHVLVYYERTWHIHCYCIRSFIFNSVTEYTTKLIKECLSSYHKSSLWGKLRLHVL